MNPFWLIVLSATLIYGCRHAGLRLDIRVNSPARDRYFRAIPFALLSALITLSIMRTPEQTLLKITLILVVGVVIQANRLRSRRAGG